VRLREDDAPEISTYSYANDRQFLMGQPCPSEAVEKGENKGVVVGLIQR